MRISVIQMNSVDDKSANLAQAATLIGEAVKEDRPDLVVLPEVYTHAVAVMVASKTYGTFPTAVEWSLM